MITIEEAYRLANNLDWREAVRGFAPGWAVVVVDVALQVVTVQRFKEKPELSAIDSLMSNHPGCAYFYTHPGMYPSIESLQRKVNDCAEAFTVNWGDSDGKHESP